MPIKFCPEHEYSKIVVKECDVCHHEWCPRCTGQDPYECPECGAVHPHIRIANVPY